MYVFYVMEVKEGNCPGFCAIVGNHEALVVESGVHLPKEYLELKKFRINLKYLTPRVMTLKGNP